MKKFFLFIPVILLIPVFLFAQKDWQFIPPKYEPEHIRLNNTEDLGNLSDIQEDNEGYFWLSGQRGFNLFDGNRLTTFRHGYKKHPLIKELYHRPLLYIVKDDKGKFWIQEDSNRCILFNPVTRKTESIENNLAAPGDEILIHGIKFIKQLSIVSVNRPAQTLSILIRTEKNKAEPIFKINMNTRRVMNYFADERNHWILTQDSILRVSSDGKEHQWYVWPRKYFLSACIYNNNFYIPDFNSQFIFKWNAETNKLEPWLQLPDILKDNLYYFTIQGDEVVFANNLNCYILNTKTKTIQDLSPDYLSLVKNETPEGLSADVQKIILKSDGNLYICTNKNLYRLKKKNPGRNIFEQQVEAKFKLTDAISYRGLAEDENKNIYVTYYNGISVKKNGAKEFVTYHTPFDIGGQNAVFHLSHYKWKLYWSNAEIDLKTGSYQYMAGNLFSDHTVHYISNDTLWFYSWHTNELNCYDLKKSVTTSSRFDKEVFKDIFTDEMNDMTGTSQPGHLWISTRANGLMLVTTSGKLIKKYTANELQLSNNFISDLERQDSILWFGCTDGLGMLNTYTGKCTIFKSSYVNNNSVFQNRVVYSLLPDEKGNLYLGTNSGLLYFDTRLHEFYNLPEKHPLSRMEFNRASVFHSSDNHFYFGTTNGLFAFTPAQLEFVKSSGTIKPVKLYAVSIFDSRTNQYKYQSENLDALQQLVLQPYENNIGLDFSVPEFYGNVYYSYRVKGFGDQWKDFKPENASINLYGLLPGDYTLEVKASTASTEMNASFYSLAIKVK